jgi:hypothetical protein
MEGTFYDYNWLIDGNDLLVGLSHDSNFDDFDDVGGALRLQDFVTGADSILYMEADLGEFNQFYSPDGGLSRFYFNSGVAVDQGNYSEI